MHNFKSAGSKIEDCSRRLTPKAEPRLKISKICEILARFKDTCRHHGWKTSENEDWVEIKNSYHNFVPVGDIHPSSFKRITNNKKCVVREGLTYRVVESSYTAWLFSSAPSETLAQTILSNPSLSCRTALYDLSRSTEDKNVCYKLNCTDSPVFREFEGFLRNELEIKLKPISPAADSKGFHDDCAVMKNA
jgi:hypothetical protein